MQLPPSQSLDNLLAGLSTDRWSADDLSSQHDMDLDRLPHPPPVLVKAEQTLRLHAESSDQSVPWSPAPPGGETTLNSQQVEFAALLRQAGMTGLSDDDIRHLYAVSEPARRARAGASAAGADSLGGAAGASGSAGAKRRGRRPADTANLTQKQLRAREAQKRFRDKQRSRMQETEEMVSQLARELQDATLVRDASSKKQAVLERLLEYKDEQVEALEWQRALNPPPGIIISPEIVEIIRTRTVPGIYTPEMLLRYNPAGYKENLDERGFVKEAPPIEKCFEDWHEMVVGLQNLLDGALVGGGRLHNREGMLEAAAWLGRPGAPVPAGTAKPRFREVGDEPRGGAATATSSSLTTRSAGGDSTSSATGGGAEAGAGASSSEGRPVNPSQQLASQSVSTPSGTNTLTASATTPTHLTSPPAAALCVDTTDPRASQLWDSIARTLVDAAQSGGPLEAPESSDDASPAASPVVADSASSEDARRRATPPKSSTSLTLPAGVVIQHGPDTYHFSEQAYRSAGVLLRRMGLLAWQQAVLFPDNAMKMTAVRGDTGKAEAEEAQDVATWRAIVRRLCLRPEQLRAIEKEVLKHRQQMLAALRNPAFARPTGRSQATYIPHMTAAVEATQGLMKGMQVEHAASCAFSGAILRAPFTPRRPCPRRAHAAAPAHGAAGGNGWGPGPRLSELHQAQLSSVD
ncbi:hypothetical protein QBZ16_001658 [Prototheca wickerhamii]|uniref:BZIP domain-containing protein n=1 Tax=Prototheca wickerhamii TaxID=3111 RepID=A0AAD9IEI2_PROWI|nr:hypothetical protein QBZ16_001658 [Prototheca wickerhamii]